MRLQARLEAQTERLSAALEAPTAESAPGEARRLRCAPAAARAPRLGGTAAAAPPARGDRGRAARTRRRPSTPDRARRCATAARAAARRHRRWLVERPDRRLKESEGECREGERDVERDLASRAPPPYTAPALSAHQCDWHRQPAYDYEGVCVWCVSRRREKSKRNKKTLCVDGAYPFLGYCALWFIFSITVNLYFRQNEIVIE